MSGPPVSVEAGDGWLSMAVQVLCLLQQHIVKHSGYVNLDIVLDGLQHSHVGSHAGQELRWLCNLLCGLVIHGHSNYGPERIKMMTTMIFE